jgi:predicted dienelactone hydrolase
LKLKKKYFILITIIFSVTTACSAVRENPVGERRLLLEDVTRMNWNTHSSPRPISTIIWYPAKHGTVEKQTNVSIFKTGWSAKMAEISPLKNKYPLILLSHGTGGSAYSISWLGKKLAQKGFIVAGINHHGNTGAEEKTLLQGFLLWWERPKDISAAIDQLLKDNYFGPKIDADRIGVAGFSLGGYTSLACVGAQLNYKKWTKDCIDNPDNSLCHLPPEAPYTIEEARNFLKSNSDAIESRKYANNNFTDKRIKAAYVIASPFGPTMTVNSLRNISVPVKIVVGSLDDQADPQSNAIPISKLIPESELLIIPNAVHYTFLNKGTIWGRVVAGNLLKDSKGIDREEIQENVGNDAVKFFDQCLNN